MCHEKRKSGKIIPEYLFLILGIGAIVVYFLVFSKVGDSCRLLFALIKFFINAFLIAFAAVGARRNGTLRNKRTVQVLAIYAAGDICCIYSVVAGGVFYVAGHLLLIASLYRTTLIRKKHVVLYIALVLAEAIYLLFVFRKDPAASWVYQVYILFLNWKTALALSSPLYLIASAIFTASDIVGIYRVVYFDGFGTPAAYAFTLGLYYVAIIFYAFATYSYETKPVVSWSDMVVLTRNLRRKGVRFCFTQGWGSDIAAGKLLPMHSDAYIAVDRKSRDTAEMILSTLGYRPTDCFDDVALYVYYSEQFGFLNVSYRTFTDKGVMLGRKEYPVRDCRSLFLKEGIPTITRN